MPWGKGMWIWYISKTADGRIETIIQKCHDYDISYVLIKGGDGGNLWSQLNHDIVSKFQNAGIKVYSWTYNYGYDPIAEANVAIKCLDLGVNGHVFDAEAEYRDAPNNVHAAETMLQAVRAKHPDKFLAHSPLPIIDFHTKFPYVTFGKYCDAVMPQIYYGKWTSEAIKQSPQKGILWVYDNFVRWEKNWRDSGHGDSVKPIIPVAQAFDDPDPKTAYTLKPADITSFVSTVSGYKSVNFWSWQHVIRNDCWNAIRDAKVDPPSDADLGRVVVAHEETQPVQTATEAPVSVVVEPPTAPVEAAPEVPSEQTVTVIGIDQNGTHVEEVVAETPTTTEIITSAPVAEVPQQTAPQKIELSPAESSTSVNVGQKTTIVLDPDANHPDGVKMTVTTHKTHQEYFIDFIVYLLSLFLKK